MRVKSRWMMASYKMTMSSIANNRYPCDGFIAASKAVSDSLFDIVLYWGLIRNLDLFPEYRDFAFLMLITNWD